jgi:hypothetical protein
MPRRVSPYGSADDAEAAALARGRPAAGGELASAMTMRDIAAEAAGAIRALNDLTSDGADFAGLDDVRQVIASLGRISQNLPRLCEQLARMLVAQREDGQITPSPGQDPDFWVVEAVEALATAGQAADMLAAALAQADKTSAELRSSLCRVDLDRDRPAQRLPDRRGGGHLPVQFGHCGLVGVGVEAHRHPDGGEPGVPIGLRVQAEEGMQVDVSVKVDAQVADRDTRHRGVGGVSDSQAVAQGAEQLLDRVGGGVRAAERRGFVRGDRREVADRGLAAEGSGPPDLGGPRGLGGRGALLDGVDQGAHGTQVDLVELTIGGRRHGAVLYWDFIYR